MKTVDIAIGRSTQRHASITTHSLLHNANLLAAELEQEIGVACTKKHSAILRADPVPNLDNLKEGVIKPDIYEPELNPLYAAVLRLSFVFRFSSL